MSYDIEPLRSALLESYREAGATDHRGFWMDNTLR